MNGNANILVDTNLIILVIGGNEQIRRQLEGYSLLISVITEIELLSLPLQNIREEQLIQEFITDCTVIDLDNEIKMHTIHLRRRQRIKIPDAIIAATSIAKRLKVFTADKGFGKIPSLDVVII